MKQAIYEAYIAGRDSLDALAESEQLLNILLIDALWERSAAWPLPSHPREDRAAYETAITLKGLLLCQIVDPDVTVFQDFIWTDDDDRLLDEVIPVLTSVGYDWICRLIGSCGYRKPLKQALLNRSFQDCQNRINEAGLSADHRAAFMLQLPVYVTRALSWVQTGAGHNPDDLIIPLKTGESTDTDQLLATSLCMTDRSDIIPLLNASYTTSESVQAFIYRLLVASACPWFSDYVVNLSAQIATGLSIHAVSIQQASDWVNLIDQSDQNHILYALQDLANTGSHEQREHAWRLHKYLCK